MNAATITAGQRATLPISTAHRFSNAMQTPIANRLAAVAPRTLHVTAKIPVAPPTRSPTAPRHTAIPATRARLIPLEAFLAGVTVFAPVLAFLGVRHTLKPRILRFG